MDLIHKLRQINHPSLEVTPDHAFTFKENGRYIHSTKAPLRESVRLIENIQQPDDISSVVVILWGVGLGYHAEELLKRGYKIIAVELRPQTAEIFKQIFPIDQLIGFIETPDHHLFDCLVNLKPQEAVTFIDIVMRGVEIPAQLHESSEKGKNALRSTHRIHKFLMDSWYNNILKNLSLMKQQTVGYCFDPFLKGQELIICSAGPSLKQSLPYLKKLQTQTTILCVDTALQSLLEYDIIPDYVHAVDAKIHNIEDFDQISKEIFSQIILIADITLSHQVLELPWKNILFTSTVQPINTPKKGLTMKRIQLMEYLWHHGIRFPELQTGGSVSNSAFHAGIIFGADKIILIGQDLAYSNHRGHVAGSSYDKEYRTRTSRLLPLDTIHSQKIPLDTPILSIDGGIAYSDILMNQFRKWFEVSIVDNPKLSNIAINASEQGAFLNHWNHQKLSVYSTNSVKIKVSIPLKRYSFDKIKDLFYELTELELSPKTSHILMKEYFYKECHDTINVNMLNRKINRLSKTLGHYYGSTSRNHSEFI